MTKVSVRFEPEGKTVDYDAAWLAANAYDHGNAQPAGWTGPGIERWDAGLQSRVPSAAYGDVAASRAALGRWLGDVRRYGFAVMTEMPTEPGTLCKVAELFGYVRETNYGRWFEVRAEVNPNNLAYTNLGLQAPHRQSLPRSGAHAADPRLPRKLRGRRRFRSRGSWLQGGGAVEGRAPFRLRAADECCARFAYEGSAGIRLRSKRPLIELGPDGELIAIRFNNRSAAAFTDIPYDDMEGFYAAYRRFAERAEDRLMEATFKLRPGELFIVDNTRVLHARRHFPARANAGSRVAMPTRTACSRR